MQWHRERHPSVLVDAVSASASHPLAVQHREYRTSGGHFHRLNQSVRPGAFQPQGRKDFA